jgi:phage terminase Nu1 subunit (DNA packaging protein)
MSIVNQTELCEILGRTAKTLNAWIDAGMPVLHRGGHGSPNQYDTEQVIAWMIQREIGKLSVHDDGTVYNFEAEKARLTHEQAEKVAMENAVRRGELVDTGRVAGWWASIITNAKQRLLAIPTKAAPLVLGRASLPEVRDQLESLINEVLLELSTTDPLACGSGDEGVETAAQADSEPVGGPETEAQPRGKRRARAMGD